MRAIDRELIKAIENQRPLDEIKELIEEGADVNIKINYEYYEGTSILGTEKKQVKKIPLAQYILEELNENIIEYQEEKYDIKTKYEINDELCLDILINIELEKYLKKSIYLIKILDLIVKNKNFTVNENFLISLMNSPISEMLKSIINLSIIKLDVIKNKEIVIELIRNQINYKYIESVIEAGININFIDEYKLTPLIYAFGYDLSDVILLLKKYDNFEKEVHEILIKKFLLNILLGKFPTFLLIESWTKASKLKNFILNLILNANAYGLNLKNILNDKFIIDLFIELKLLNELINQNILKINEKIKNKTLLELALQKQDYKLAKFLIKKGADVNININNMNLLEFAKFIKDKELINLIKSSPTYKPLDHNPKELVKILTNFRKDSPIKYTTHNWDFDFRKEYGNFDNYMKKVKKQWDEIEKELKELSLNIHKKTELFLFANDEEDVWSSAEGDKLAIGWSNLKGLREWCDNGKSPFDFKLPKIYEVEGKTVSKFADVINIFKREIQIRNENDHLKSIFSNYRNILYKKAKFKIKMEKLQGKNFYTDVETFKKVLDMIFFEEILKREKYPNIIVEAKNDNEKFFDLSITQVDSFSYLSPKEMLNKSDGGDFAKIKKALKNLCDWSIENKDEKGKSYRVNYLISTCKDRIEYLDEEIKGFTYILRFYK